MYIPIATTTSEWSLEWGESKAIPHVLSTTPGRLGKGTSDHRVGGANVEWEGLYDIRWKWLKKSSVLVLVCFCLYTLIIII